MFEDSEKIGLERRLRNYGNTFVTRKLLLLLALMTALVWGSLSLLSLTIHYGEIIAGRQKETFATPGSLALGNESVDSDTSPTTKPALSLEIYRQGRFSPKFKEIQWIKDSKSISHDRGSFVMREDSEIGFRYSIRSILNGSYERPVLSDSCFTHDDCNYDIDDLIISPDLNKAILKTNTTKNWRHSTFALYWILDLDSRQIRPLFDTKHKLSVAIWSPTSSSIAFVYYNDIYIRDIAASDIIRVTYDKDLNIFNGIPDWVYEEEVFESDIAMWWSPKGDKLAFFRANDSQVPIFTIPYYAQNKHMDYPKYKSLKYPKAGYPNPQVDLFVYDVNLRRSASVSRTWKGGTDSEKMEGYILTEILWVSDSLLLFKRTNRASDHLEIYLMDADSSNVSLVRTHKATDSWFEVNSNSYYIPKNKALGIEEDGYIDNVAVDGYTHLVYFSPPWSSHGIILTRGFWEVVSGVEAFDYTNGQVYFTGTKRSSIERHIYTVNLVEALTSGHSPKLENVTDVSSDGWYTASFSAGSKFILLTYLGPSTPYQKLLNLENGTFIRDIEKNDELRKSVSRYDLPKVTYSTISLGIDNDTGEDIIANAQEIFPPHFNVSKKYPVLFFVYGGPGSQMVKKAFEVSFSSVVASELNCLVVTVDGRGTGFNNNNFKLGSRFKYSVKNKLGYYEPRDQITAAKLWARKPYVDRSRIAIWGWSYGGFLTLKTLETDHTDRIFSYGVAVAPVTRWKLYDSVYTERYMGLPKDNEKGYEISSISSPKNFSNVRRFFVMHGSGDDNVHFQNSLELIDAFNLANIENYDFMVFPDSDHSIRYHNGNNVIYDRMLTWLSKVFKV